MNVIALDRRASGRLIARGRTVTPRPEVLRRLITLPGTSRMRKPELEPTRLISGKPHHVIEIVDSPLGSRWDAFIVLFAFIGFFFRTTWRKITRRADPVVTGRDLRAVFERLGGMWMKVGQLMSLRRDVLPEAMCDELANLQHRAHGFSPDIAMKVIERELGMPIERAFSAFDPHPFAAASLSQVHLARLRNSQIDVVVKVLRPGVREKFERDLRILRFIATRLNRIPSLRQFRLRDALGEFEQIFREETDYRYEISNMRAMRKSTKGHKLYIPKVFADISTQNMIIMERVSGVLMSDYIRIRREEPERVREWLRANNIDSRLVGQRLLISFMRQLFENNLFHADLHPGNIILLRDSRIALIDMGSVGSLDREFLTLYRGVQRALAERDYGRAADLQLRLCAQLPSRNLQELRMELARTLRIWSDRTRVKHLPFHDRSVNTGAAEVSRILYRFGAQQTWEFLKIARTLSTLDASLQHLHEDLDYIKILQNYFRKAAARGMKKAMSLSNLAQGISYVGATLEEYHLMMGPVLRASAFSFEATISKASRVFALVVRMGLLGIAVVMAGLGYRYVMENHPAIHAEVQVSFLDKLVTASPNLLGSPNSMEEELWAFGIIASILTLLVLRRILGELTRTEGRNGRRS